MLSNNLETTLQRTLDSAKKSKHEYATLEHLLLSLTEDSDASSILSMCKVDIKSLRRRVSRFLNNDLQTSSLRFIEQSKPTAGVERVIARAKTHVDNSKKQEITGADILSEIFLEDKSYAVSFLNEFNLTREMIVKYINHPAFEGQGNEVGLKSPKQESKKSKDSFFNE